MCDIILIYLHPPGASRWVLQDSMLIAQYDVKSRGDNVALRECAHPN